MKLSTLNLVLLLTAAGLFGRLAIDEHAEQISIAKAIERQPPLTTLDPNAIRRIRLHHPDSTDIVLEKAASGWQMKAPVALAADLLPIADLLALATRETRGSLDPATVKRAELGLDPPLATIQFDDTVIAIGATEPLKHSRYVERIGPPGDARIQLVDDFPAEPFDDDFTDLVNKALLPFDAVITRLALPGLIVSRDPAAADAWTTIPAASADRQAELEQRIRAWHEVRAVATLPPMIDTAAAGNAAADVTVTLGHGEPLAYRIVDKAGARFLQRLDVPVSYQLSPADADRLLKWPATAAARAPAGAAQ
jgi:hypothetical protein